MAVRTIAEVKAAFAWRGVSVSAWARSRGVSAHLTYQILSGKKLGIRGQSHDIAVMLGLKEGLPNSTGDPLQVEFSPAVIRAAIESGEKLPAIKKGPGGGP